MKKNHMRGRRAFSFAISMLAVFFSMQAHAADVLNVQVTGQGPPMILIPGVASSGDVWIGTVAHYQAKYQCIVITLEGFAGKEPVPGPFLESAEAALSAYISEHGLVHVVMVGHSLGGTLALKVAEDHPDQIEKLVIVDALPALGAATSPNATHAELEKSATDVRNALLQSDVSALRKQREETASTMVTSAEDADRIAGWGERSDPTTVANAMYELLAIDLRPGLGKIKAPTLVLATWIAFKQFAPRAAIEGTFVSQYRGLPFAHIVMSDTSRHFVMYDDPQWMFSQIDGFLEPGDFTD